MKRILALFLAFILMSTSPAPDGDKDDTNAMFKAAYLYTFTKLVDWPARYKKGDFIIGVLGSSPSLYDHLKQKYASKNVGSQTIRVKEFSSVAQVEQPCHILFISRENYGVIGQVLKGTNNTLIVTEKDGALQEGAVINFVVQNNKLEYELSKTNASKYELVIGSQLRDLALKVE